VGEPFDLHLQVVGRELFDGCDDAGVEGTPPLREDAVIGLLLHEGVREGVSERWHGTRLIEKLRRLQVLEAALQPILCPLHKSVQQEP
jgi:hypothetical protein